MCVVLKRCVEICVGRREKSVEFEVVLWDFWKRWVIGVEEGEICEIWWRQTC